MTGSVASRSADAGGAATIADADLRRAKEAAEAANEAKTRYMVALSHEIRSPLNVIYGYAQLLERDDTVSGAEAGTIIRRSAEHVTNLVEGLLEISRIETGALRIRSDIVDPRGLLEHVVDMFRMQAAAKGLTLELILRDRLPAQVKADEKRLRQILINLVSNAVKYTEQGGVVVSVRYRSQVADIEVSDTGIGIAPDDLDRVFEPFNRGSSAEARLQPGVGLGLAITRVLAWVLGGDIAATSTPGVGSKFRLRLMLPSPATPVGGVVPGSRITGYAGPRRAVLVIDDDPAQGAILRSLLRPLGFVVQVAEIGADGIALAGGCRVDLVLLDIQMPGMNGWEVAERLRAAHGDALRIAMLSANAHEVRDGGDERGRHDAFMTKPFELDALLAMIGDLLDLQWERAEPVARRDTLPPSDAMPAEALPFIKRLRDLAGVGHIRGMESTIDELEKAVPDAAPLASALRGHLRQVDLRSFIKTLDDAEK